MIATLMLDAKHTGAKIGFKLEVLQTDNTDNATKPN